MEDLIQTKPSILGLRRSFGFGDRLGLATPGHLDAVRGTSFVPILAQQSIRELTRTQRQPEEVMLAAQNAVRQQQWTGPWGADADHLQTKEDVQRMAGAGFTFFTIDPSAFVNNQAGILPEKELVQVYQNMLDNDKFIGTDLFDLYYGNKFEIAPGTIISFDDRLVLIRALVKYGAALKHTEKMYQWIETSCDDRPFEVEMSIDETDIPTSPLEHLFIGLELRRLQVKLVSLAPRFIGEFEKGIDYKGDLATFAAHFDGHVAIANYCGPYKLSIHSGSDKFSIYPIVGRLSRDLLHVKTAGTSYLEALRVVCRTDKKLFRDIIYFCRARYDRDRASYHVSASLTQVPEKLLNQELEQWYLENNSGRQILHVTFGSVLAGGKAPDGGFFKEKIIENLRKNDDLYRQVLHQHLGKHIRLLEGK